MPPRLLPPRFPPPARTPPHMVTLVLLTAVSVLSLNMFLPSLANVARDMNVSYAVASLSVSGYLALTAVLQLVMGPLSDRFGRRPVLLTSVAVFTLASLVCLVAQDIRLFLAGRVMQGAIISGGAISSAVIRDTNDEARAASLLSYVSVAMAVAPMLGPALGGLLDQAFGWRANFVVYAAMGAALTWLVWADLGETHTDREASFADQFRQYPTLLRSRRFWGYALCVAFGVGAFFTFVAGAPLIAEQVYGLSPAAVGIGIGSITGGFMAGSFVSGRFVARLGTVRMMLIGRVVAVAGLAAGLAAFAAGHGGLWVFFAATLCIGLANGLSIPPARAGLMSLNPRLAGSASGLSGAMVVAGGAVFTTLPGLLLTGKGAAWQMLALLLALSLAALVAALWVWAVDRRERAEAAI